MSTVLFSIPMVWVRALNTADELISDGNTPSAETVLAKMREKCALAVSTSFFAPHGIPYLHRPPLDFIRAYGFSSRSMSEDEMHGFAEIGWPNPRQDEGFNLAFIQVPRYELSMGGMDLLLKECAATHACLREGLIFLERSPEKYGHHSVHFFGSRRPDPVGTYTNVPSISLDAGIRLLSRRRIDTGSHLFPEVYAIVRRGLPIG